MRPSGTGEPHLFTFDGLAHDFEFVGEFVFFGGEDGAVVQIRTKPYEGPVYPARGWWTWTSITANTRSGSFRLLGDDFLFLLNGTHCLEFARIGSSGTETQLPLELAETPIHTAQIIEAAGQTVYLRYGSDTASFFAEITCTP